MHNIWSQSVTVFLLKWDDKREPQNLSIGNVVKLEKSGRGWSTNIFISVIHWILCWPQLANIIMQMPWCQMAPGHQLRPSYLVGYSAYNTETKMSAFFDEIFTTKFSSLEVVKMTTSSAASDDNFVKMTFSFRWITCRRIRTNTLYSQFIIPLSIYQ